MRGDRAGTVSGSSARGWAWAHRPEEMVEATRWLFAAMVMVAIPITLVVPLWTSAAAVRLVALGAALLLLLSLGTGYLRRSATLGMDLTDSVAIGVLALTSPQPAAVLGFVFPVLWFRSLYGTTRAAVLRCFLYAVALVITVPLWSQLALHTTGVDVGALAGAIPTMFLTVIVGRHLAGTLGARQQDARRDGVHASVGAQLLAVTDPDAILRIAWAATTEICAATPGLRVLKVVRHGASLRVDGATGGFAAVPATLPMTAVSAPGRVDSRYPPADARDAMDAAVGVRCDWSCVRLPVQHSDAWLLLGSPKRVPHEAIVSIGSLANQVALAMRNAEVHRELTVQATLDGLTGLANRTSFNAALTATLDDGPTQLASVLFVDLDDFKDINDVLGHGAGDDLLREVAARLRQATRPQDLCARLGGDEFAVLLRGTDAKAAAEVAQRIVHTVAVPVFLGTGMGQVGASVGIATATGETDLEQLIHRADVAMYAAKARGKARIQVFEPSLLQVDPAQGSFRRQLSAAADNGELVVHYQPVVSLHDGRCTAVEALVRWQHPEQGLLYPGAFIEIAEQTGAIHKIGTHVLRQACADLASWQRPRSPSPLAVHVNVSALQLDDVGFFDTVIACLDEFSLRPDQLVLEITETVVISSPSAISRLNELAAHGVTLAIDDFGTGYSALTTLRSLPVKIVKIDRSFIAGSTLNPEDRTVTEAVVTMASQLGLQTIAEGVERTDQQTYLTEIGADAAQGYLYLRPTTAHEFGAWFDQHLAGLPTRRHTDQVVTSMSRLHLA